MAKEPDDMRLLDRMKAGLVSALAKTPAHSAQLTLYGLAAGAVALTAGAQLPPELAVLVSSMGFNALSDMLKQVAEGKNVPDEQKVKSLALAADELKKHNILQDPNNQRAIGELIANLSLLRQDIQESNYVLWKTIAGELQEYKGMQFSLSFDIAGLDTKLNTLLSRTERLPTRDQLDDMKKLLSGAARMEQEDELVESDFSTFCDYIHHIVSLYTYVRQELSVEENRPAPLLLDQVFIPLRAARKLPNTDQRLMDEEIQQRIIEGQKAVLEINNEIDKILASNQIRGLKEMDGSVEGVDLDDALTFLKQDERSVLLGEPGSGKSTTLHYLALQHALAIDEQAEAFWGQVTGALPEDEWLYPADLGSIRFPIIFRIADYAEELKKDGGISVVDFLFDSYPGRIGFHHSPERLRRIIKQALVRGTCLILLDGLDEITKTDDRQKLSGRIVEFSRVFARPEERANRSSPSGRSAAGYQNQVIVSSRIAGYFEARLSSDFVTYTLAPLNEVEMTLFLQKWFTQNARAVDTGQEEQDQVESLMASILASASLQRLARSPLILHLLATLFVKNKALPHQRAELYEQVTNLLLKEWNERRGISLDQLYNPEEARVILETLAQWLHTERPTGLIADTEFSQALGHASGTDAPKLADFIERIRQGSGIFVILEKGQNLYGFMHLTFEEYFSGRSWARDAAPEQYLRMLLKYIHQPRWREPLLFSLGYYHRYCTQGEHTCAILAGLLNHHSRYEDVLHRDLLLVVDCVIENQIQDETLLEEIERQLIVIYCDPDGQGKIPPLLAQVRSALRQLCEMNPELTLQVIDRMLDRGDILARPERLLDLAVEFNLLLPEAVPLLRKYHEKWIATPSFNQLAAQLNRRFPEAGGLYSGWLQYADKPYLQLLLGFLWNADINDSFPGLLLTDSLNPLALQAPNILQAVGAHLALNSVGLTSLIPLFRAFAKNNERALAAFTQTADNQEIAESLLSKFKNKLVRQLHEASSLDQYQDSIALAVCVFSTDSLLRFEIAQALAGDLEQGAGQRCQWAVNILKDPDHWAVLKNHEALQRSLCGLLGAPGELSKAAFDLLASHELTPGFLAELWKIIAAAGYPLSGPLQNGLTARLTVTPGKDIFAQLDRGLEDESTRGLAVEFLKRVNHSEAGPDTQDGLDSICYLFYWLALDDRAVRMAAARLLASIIDAHFDKSIMAAIGAVFAALYQNAGKNGEEFAPAPMALDAPVVEVNLPRISPEARAALIAPDLDARIPALTVLCDADLPIFILAGLVDASTDPLDEFREACQQLLYALCANIPTDGSTSAPEWLALKLDQSEQGAEITVLNTAAGKVVYQEPFWIERWIALHEGSAGDGSRLSFMPRIDQISDQVLDFLYTALQQPGLSFELREALKGVLQETQGMNDLGLMMSIEARLKTDFIPTEAASPIEFFDQINAGIARLEQTLQSGSPDEKLTMIYTLEKIAQAYQPVNVLLSNAGEWQKTLAWADMDRHGFPLEQVTDMADGYEKMFSELKYYASSLSELFPDLIIWDGDDENALLDFFSSEEGLEKLASAFTLTSEDGQMFASLALVHHRKDIVNEVVDLVCSVKDDLDPVAVDYANRALVYFLVDDGIETLEERFDQEIELLWALLDVAVSSFKELQSSHVREGLNDDLLLRVVEWLKVRQGDASLPTPAFKHLRDALLDELDQTLRFHQGERRKPPVRISNSWEVRYVIMQALSLLAQWRITPLIHDRPDLVSIMVRAARDSSSFSVRAMALKILGLQQQLTDEVLDVLIGSLQASPFTDQDDVREAAAGSMAEYKYFPLKSFDRLIASLDSPSPAVIQTAIQIITELGRSRSEELGGKGRNSLADGLYRCLRGHTGYEIYPGFYEEIYNALFCVVSGSLPKGDQANAPEQAGIEGGLLARYLTTYSAGDDLYDESFSIDSPSGEFLGECGVGISNTAVAGYPKKVNALDVWLFDKNDIQTVTHVYLTDAALTDASVRRILEGKGEPHLIRNHARSVLRTATLEMRVEVVDFEYLQDPGLSYHSAVGKITYAIEIFSR